MSQSRRPMIVGVHVTRQARRLDDEPQVMLMQAVRGALADAGIDPRDVDGAAAMWCGPGGVPGEAASWAPFLRRPLAYTGEHWSESAGVRGIVKAAAAIEAGLCDTIVLASGADNRFRGVTVGADQGFEFSDVFGTSAMAHFALLMQRYMYEYGVSAEAMGHVAATIRNHGHTNPEAVMFGAGPYTVDDILASPMIASPLHRLECCIVNEGACAVVMTTAERARDLRQTPIAMLGSGMEFWGAPYGNPPLLRDLRNMGKSAAARTFGQAGVTARDVDVFALYDAVAFEVVRQLEMLGLCGEGEGAVFAAGDRLTRTGDCPTNLDGGNLSHSWIMTGQLTLKVIECVRQLRGGAGERQVEGAELALATNAGSATQHIEMLLLGRG